MVRAPQSVQPALVCRVDVVNHAVLHREGAHAGQLSRVSGSIESAGGREHSGDALRGVQQQREEGIAYNFRTIPTEAWRSCRPVPADIPAWVAGDWCADSASDA